MNDEQNQEFSEEDKQMIDSLVRLVDTEFWQAIKRYNRMQDNRILTSLGSIDPFKEPTTIARSQGMRMGLFQLEHDAETEAKTRNDMDAAANN